MKLFLAVPKQSKQSSSDMVTRPGQTREWIAKLPLLNSRESLQQIYGSLYGINRTSLKATQRLKLLDMYRSPLRVIRSQVETHLAKGVAPLPDNDLLMAELFRDCCVELAYGYKSIILEIAQSPKRRQLDEMRLSMGRALFYLEQTVFACVIYHQAAPEGIWQEIHTIYQYALKLGISEDAIKDPIVKTQATTTITLLYKRAILFGLSDPFHQSVPLMSRVLDFLRRRAQNAQLTNYRRPPTERCQFVIDPQSDYPAKAYVKQENQKPPGDALLLDTVNLTRHAHDQLKRLQSAEQVDVELDDEFRDDLGKKLLEEVVYTWGLIPRRQEDRVETEGDRAEMVVGISVVTFVMNEEKPFEPSSAEDGGRHSVVRPLETHLTQKNFRQQKLGCEVLDRAESGLRLSVPYDVVAVGSLRVGDVIASREEEGEWIPGMIRWMRCVDDSIQFGVKQLRQSASPIAVKPVSTDRDAPFKEGIVMYIDGAETLGLQLITPPGMFRPQRNLFVDDGEKLLMARSQSLIERNQVMEWFECETINL